MNKQKELRIRVLNKYLGHCAYCGKEIDLKSMQIDHITPKWRKERFVNSSFEPVTLDTDRFENLNPSCRRCNHYKRGENLEGFRRNMKTIHERISLRYINKVAIDYGIIILNPFNGIFYFETLNQEKEQAMTAAELKRRAFKQSAFPFHYYFTPDEMQAFIDQVCKEQREKCEDVMQFTQSLEEKKQAIRNAPKPEGL